MEANVRVFFLIPRTGRHYWGGSWGWRQILGSDVCIDWREASEVWTLYSGDIGGDGWGVDGVEWCLGGDRLHMGRGRVWGQE